MTSLPRAANGSALGWICAAAALATIAAATIAHAATQVRAMKKVGWDKSGMLHGVLDMRDAIDDPVITKKLKDGLPVTVIVRGYVVPTTGGNPIVFTAHTCHVAFDLWNEVFRITENGATKPPVINLKGVYRHCTDMDLAIVTRADLPAAPPGFDLSLKIDVNPVDPKLQDQIKQWITRPQGTTGTISPGDALFATFANVFMNKKIPPAQLVIEFDTPPFPP